MHSCLCRALPTFPRQLLARLSSTTTSVDSSEVSKFTALSSQWWSDPSNGPFAGLHRMNDVRVPLIRRAMCRNFLARRTGGGGGSALQQPSPSTPLAGLSLLDAGCGGGILSEALARLGASMTGVDASAQAVAAATAHAQLDPAVAANTRYLASTVEALAAQGALFDGVVCSEVIEHVASPEAFLGHLTALTRPGGHLVLTTINRSLPAFWGAVLAAEYVLRLVPPGTHEWAKFIKPEELTQALQAGGSCTVELVTGLAYNPLSGNWSTTGNTSMNYALVARRKGGEQEA